MCLTRVFAALAPRNYSKEVSYLKISNLEKNGNEWLTGSVLWGSSWRTRPLVLQERLVPLRRLGGLGVVVPLPWAVLMPIGVHMCCPPENGEHTENQARSVN